MNYALKTTNKSFINMWRHLQRHNISNNLFMLKTLDKDLVDFSIEKFLSMDKEDPYYRIYKKKIIDEARENIWFYFRELIMIPDEDSLGGYKHFELNQITMQMIYLYEQHRSFINDHVHNDLANMCLYFIWNRHKCLYNTDLVLYKNSDAVDSISATIKKHISKMPCQVPFGSNQIMSDDYHHRLNCSEESINNYFLQTCTMLFDSIDKVYKTHINTYNNDILKNAIFILETEMPIISYSYILDLSKKYKMYLNSIRADSVPSKDYAIFDNFLYMLYPTFNDDLYDMNPNDLKSIYII